jgi:hypothetical protein
VHEYEFKERVFVVGQIVSEPEGALKCLETRSLGPILGLTEFAC